MIKTASRPPSTGEVFGMNANANANVIEIEGAVIEMDRSGLGNCWEVCYEGDVPAQIVEEITCEIIDGKQAECDNYVASNGFHYRWH